jgi:putative spermidine/putrescine transport system ATP-binding protein
VRVVIEDVAFLGAVVRLKVRFGDSVLHIDTFNAGEAGLPRQGETLDVGFRREDVIVLDDG